MTSSGGGWNGDDDKDPGKKDKPDPKELPTDFSRLPLWKRKQILEELQQQAAAGWQDTGPTGGYVLQEETVPVEETVATAQSIQAEQRALEQPSGFPPLTTGAGTGTTMAQPIGVTVAQAQAPPSYAQAVYPQMPVFGPEHWPGLQQPALLPTRPVGQRIMDQPIPLIPRQHGFPVQHAHHYAPTGTSVPNASEPMDFTQSAPVSLVTAADLREALRQQREDDEAARKKQREEDLVNQQMFQMAILASLQDFRQSMASSSSSRGPESHGSPPPTIQLHRDTFPMTTNVGFGRGGLSVPPTASRGSSNAQTPSRGRGISVFGTPHYAAGGPFGQLRQAQAEAQQQPQSTQNASAFANAGFVPQPTRTPTPQAADALGAGIQNLDLNLSGRPASVGAGQEQMEQQQQQAAAGSQQPPPAVDALQAAIAAGIINVVPPAVPAAAPSVAPQFIAHEASESFRRQWEASGPEDRLILEAHPRQLNEEQRERRNELYRLRNRQCINCSQRGHVMGECGAPCPICNGTDHKKPFCPHKKRQDGAGGSGGPPPKRGGGGGGGPPRGGGSSGGGTGAQSGSGSRQSRRGSGFSQSAAASQKRSQSRGGRGGKRQQQGGNGGPVFSSSSTHVQNTPYFRPRKPSVADSKKGFVDEPSLQKPLLKSAIERAYPKGFTFKPFTKNASTTWNNEGIEYVIGHSSEMVALGVLCDRNKDYGLDSKGRQRVVPLIIQFGFESGDRIGHMSEGDVYTVKEYWHIARTDEPDKSYGFRPPTTDLGETVINGMVVPDALARTYYLKTPSSIYIGKRILVAVDCHQEIIGGFISLDMKIAGVHFEQGKIVGNGVISRNFDISVPMNAIFVQADISIARADEFCALAQIIVPASIAPELVPMSEDLPRVSIVSPVPNESLDFIQRHGNFTGFIGAPIERTEAFNEILRPALTGVFCAEYLVMKEEKRQAKVLVEVSAFHPGHEIVFKVVSRPTNNLDVLRHRQKHLKPVSDVTLYGRDENGQHKLAICNLKTIALVIDNENISEITCKRVIEIQGDSVLSDVAMQQQREYSAPHATDVMYWHDKNFPYKELMIAPRMTDVSAECRIKFIKSVQMDLQERPINQLVILNLLTGVGCQKRSVYQKFMNPDKKFPDDFSELNSSSDSSVSDESSDEDMDEGPKASKDDASKTAKEAMDVDEPTSEEQAQGSGVVPVAPDASVIPIPPGFEASGPSGESHDPAEQGSPRLVIDEDSNEMQEQAIDQESDKSMDSDDELNDRIHLNVALRGKWPKKAGNKSHEDCLALVGYTRTSIRLNMAQKYHMCDLIIDEAPLVPISAPSGTGKSFLLSDFAMELSYSSITQFNRTNLLCVAEVNGAVERIANEILRKFDKLEAVIQQNAEATLKRKSDFYPLRALVLKSTTAEAENEPHIISEAWAPRWIKYNTLAHAEHLLMHNELELGNDDKGLLSQFVHIKRDFPDIVFNEKRVIELILKHNKFLTTIICTRALACANEGILQWTHRIVFEEASQIRHVDGLLMIAHTPRLVQVVMAGDVEQVDPYIPDYMENRFFGIGQVSLLEYTECNTALKMPLVVTYRMSEPMADLLQKVIYKAGLTSKVEHWFLPEAFNFPVAVDGYPVMLLHTVAKAKKLTSGSWTNTTHVQMACHMVNAIAKHGRDSDYAAAVAVICIYAGDAKAIQDSMAEYCPEAESLGSLVVETVNSYMGNENDFTILVTGREWAEPDQRGIEPFALWPKPFTVAVSRARHHTTIIGNTNFLTSSSGSRVEKFVSEVAYHAAPLDAEWYIGYLKSKQVATAPTYHEDSGCLITSSGGTEQISFIADCDLSAVNGWCSKFPTRIREPLRRL